MTVIPKMAIKIILPTRSEFCTENAAMVTVKLNTDHKRDTSGTESKDAMITIDSSSPKPPNNDGLTSWVFRID
jgi:hypothetical protein